MKRAVAARTLSISGVGAVSATAAPVTCRVRSAPSARRVPLWRGIFMTLAPFRRCRCLLVKIRIEDTNLGDALDGKLVAARRAADRLGRGPVVDAEGLLPIRAHVGMHPGHLLRQVAL